jgi:MFS transporter, CP family, cyanate transporter
VGAGAEGGPASRSAPAGRPLAVTAAVLFLVALALRPDLIGIGPLLELIQADLGASRGVVGLLATIPVVAMGVFSPAAARLGRRLGPDRVVILGLVAIAVCGVARGSATGIGLMLVCTVGVGAGIALAQTLLPAIVRARAAAHVPLITTVYVVGIQLGAAGGAALSSTLGTAVGWRAPLLAFGALAGTWALVWWWFTSRPAPAVAAPVRAPGRDGVLWRHPLVWILVVVYGTQSFVFFGVSSWLPGYLMERGWQAASAGQSVTVASLAGLLGTLLTPRLLRRTGSVRAALMATGSLATASLLALLVLPGAGLALAFLAGLGMGPLFPTILQLPIAVADDLDDVGSVTGIMLGVGYLFAAIAPTALGALRDLTGSFLPVMGALAGMLAVFVLSCLALAPDRVARGVRTSVGRSG